MTVVSSNLAGNNAIDPSAVQQPGASNGTSTALNGFGGRLLDSAGRPFTQLPHPDTPSLATVWLPFNEGSGSLVYDQCSQLQGNMAGGGESTNPRWNSWGPGLSFNGSNNRIPMTSGSSAGAIFSAKSLFDLSTLQARNDMIVCWAVLSHSPTVGDYATDATIFGWGCQTEAKGGWAWRIKASNQKPMFSLRPKGGSATVDTTLGTNGLLGSTTDNGRSAICMILAYSGTSGYLEASGFSLPLHTSGTDVAYSSVGLVTPQMVPNGTGLPNYDVTGLLTIGAWPTTDSSTFANYLGPKCALAQLGIQRRPYDIGLGMRIVRDLRRNIRLFPPSAR